MHVAELKNVQFRYGRQTVLSDITFSIQRGDFLALIGPNGSGKTTLLRILLGLLPPTRGEVRLFDKPLAEARAGGRIGYVPQNASHVERDFPGTAREIVSTGLYAAKGLFRQMEADDWNKVDAALAAVGMRASGHQLIGDLSGGQRQRVLLAKALVSDPEFLILDEPTTGVDEKSEHEFYDLLDALNRKGVTILIVSHDIGLVSTHVRRIVCIDQTLVFHGDSAKFRKLVREKPDLFAGHRIVAHHHHGEEGHD